MSFTESTESVVVGWADKLIAILNWLGEIFGDGQISTIIVSSDLFLPFKRVVISNIVMHHSENDVPKMTRLHEENIVFMVRSQLIDILS